MDASQEAMTATVEAVARRYEAETLRRSPFHISACGGCGGPSFQQPCPHCSYYPMGSDRGSWSPKALTREAFVANVGRSGTGGVGGNIATWYFRATCPSLVAHAQAMDGLVDPGEAFDFVADGGRASRADHPDSRLWHVLDDLRYQHRLLDRSMGSPAQVLSASEGLTASARACVTAIHDGDAGAKAEAARGLEERLRDLRAKRLVEANGNLETALGWLGKAVEDYAAAAAPAP